MTALADKRVMVALLLVAGARTRAVCRTEGCTWRGQAWMTRDHAAAEQAHHRSKHLAAVQRPRGGRRG